MCKQAHLLRGVKATYLYDRRSTLSPLITLRKYHMGRIQNFIPANIEHMKRLNRLKYSLRNCC